MSNSPLVRYTKLSPNKTAPRNHPIDTVTVHCVVGQCAVEALGAEFAKPAKRASSNYGIGYDGKIGLYVEEKDRSWCSSNAANDHRAITIEVASDTREPYAVTEKAYAALLDLLTDICKRNGIPKLVWSTSKDDRVNHRNGCNMTVHRDYANKSCPGTYLYERHGEIAAEVNRRLAACYTEVNYTATVTAKTGLNCREYPVSGKVVRTYPTGAALTITKESDGWGYTGEGWVSLAYVRKILEEETDMTAEQVKQIAKDAAAEIVQAYRDTLQDNDAGKYSAEAREWAVSTGLINGGDPLPDGSPNYMWQDFITREQAATILYRFAQTHGLA